jgi:hypothetical protein
MSSAEEQCYFSSLLLGSIAASKEYQIENIVERLCLTCNPTERSNIAKLVLDIATRKENDVAFRALKAMIPYMCTSYRLEGRIILEGLLAAGHKNEKVLEIVEQCICEKAWATTVDSLVSEINVMCLRLMQDRKYEFSLRVWRALIENCRPKLRYLNLPLVFTSVSKIARSAESNRTRVHADKFLEWLFNLESYSRVGLETDDGEEDIEVFLRGSLPEKTGSDNLVQAAMKAFQECRHKFLEYEQQIIIQAIDEGIRSNLLSRGSVTSVIEGIFGRFLELAYDHLTAEERMSRSLVGSTTKDLRESVDFVLHRAATFEESFVVEYLPALRQTLHREI